MSELEKVIAVIRGCQIADYGNMDAQMSAEVMKQIILGAVRGLIADKPFTEKREGKEPGDIGHPMAAAQMSAQLPSKPFDAARPCRRGDAITDDKGQPFQHSIPSGLTYCIFCGGGLPASKAEPDKNANIYASGGEEKVWCDEHGFHILKVRPDGTYENPPDDCAMFKAKEQL